MNLVIFTCDKFLSFLVPPLATSEYAKGSRMAAYYVDGKFVRLIDLN
jgi:hypothetical protein